MGMVMIRLKPGVDVESTPSLSEAAINQSNLIRFRSGLPEKLGGWTRYYPFAVGGVPKALHPWLDANENQYLAVGTTTLLGTISNGTLADITPQTLTSDFAPNFTTVATSTTVAVVDANINGVTTFDSVEFLTPVSIGGIILSGVYPIDLILGATSYDITAASPATGSISNGGAVPVFNATSGSATLGVTLANHGTSVFSKVNFPIETVLNVAGNDSFTKSLLHMNGADATTTFTDSNAGGSAHSWTAAGNAQIDTAVFKFGGASGLFDGTGDWVTTPDSADFTLGSGDWTVDFWFECNAAGGTVQRICGQCDSTPTNASTSFRIQRTAGNVIQAIACVSTTATTITGTTQYTNAVNTGEHHGALVRTGNVLKLFIDGVQQGGNQAITGTVNDSASVLAIGTEGAVSSTPWNGWLDEFRLSVGIARWTTTFVPPVAEYGGEEVSVLGTYTVIAVADANNFSIGLSQQAGSTGSTAMNGGDVRLKYYITLGPASATSGYGVGTYGSGGYGTGSSTGQQVGTPITATNWTLDNWGEILLANPDGGGLYQWRPNLGLQNAQLVEQAPIHNTGMFVSMQTQMVIAYGATADLTLQNPVGIGLDFDPLLVAWCDTGDFTNWTISTVSQAGSRRLPTGSKIIGGLSVPNQELLWTDLDLWAMSYLGSLENGVWGFNKIGSSCGLIGRHAATRQGSNVYWMSGSNFFVLGGGAPQVIPCSVWDAVFQDLNTTTDPDTGRPYSAKSWAWSNTPFNEIWFFFPRASTGATEPDAYAKFNTLDGFWDNVIQAFDRSAGIDQSIVGQPIAATSAGIIYEHETSPDGDGQAINSYFVTGLYQLSEGQDLMFVDWFLPDFTWKDYASSGGSASIQITFYGYKYLSDTPRVYGPFTVTSATPYFNPRIRARFLAWKVESNDIGSWWRNGGNRARTAVDGRQ